MAWLNREIGWAANDGSAALLALVKARVAEFNAINVATALHRLARLRGRGAAQDEVSVSDPAIVALVDKTRELMLLPPGPQCDARAVSTFAHALATLGIQDEAVAQAVAEAVSLRADGLDRQGVANVAWALAKLPKVKGTVPLLRRLAARVRGAELQAFWPQELSNLLWALGKLGVRDNKLMSEAADAAKRKLNEFTPQGLATVAAAFAQVGVFVETLLVAIGDAALLRLSELNGRDAAQLVWAHAKFKLRRDELLETLCARAAELDLASEGKELVVSFLWSFGSLRWVPAQQRQTKAKAGSKKTANTLLPRLLTRASELAPKLGARRLVRLLTAAAKLRDDSVLARDVDGECCAGLAKLAQALAIGISGLVDRMAAQEVGFAAWALATLRPKSWQDTLKLLRTRALESDVADELNWWSVAHLEYACRLAGCCGVDSAGASDPEMLRLLSVLTSRSLSESVRLAADSDAFQQGPAQAVVDVAPWGTGSLGPGKSVLVVGPGRAVRRALRQTGAAVCSWKRFAAGPVGVSTCSWPDAPVDSVKFDAACIRYPASGDAFDYAVHAVAACLKPWAPIWVYGDVREGVLSATKGLKTLFKAKLPIKEQGDVRIITAKRTDAVPTAPLQAWLREGQIDLGDGARSWTSLPGLFADGMVDVMSKFLLETLAKVATEEQPRWSRKAGCRVLDFACGTGVLAAGTGRLLRPSAQFWMLDADAAALEAARRNLPDARAVVLADGFLGLSAEEEAASTCFDLIVSNPPVHRGYPDDLRVLQGLLSGAFAWLRPGGELWLVTQEHIPTGRLFAQTEELEGADQGCDEFRSFCRDVQMYPTSDGRFVVWRALRPRSAGDGDDRRSGQKRRGSQEECEHGDDDEHGAQTKRRRRS